jgi:hypothetical protein
VVAAGFGVAQLIGADGNEEVVTSDEGPIINFVDPEEQLFTYETTIRRLIAEAYAQAEPLLDVDGVEFAVSLEISGLPIADYGVGYSLTNGDTVVIAVDPFLPRIRDVLPERMAVIVASGLYDFARSREVAPDETFFETMVWLGIGGHFVEDLLGTPPPWVDSFPETRTEEFMEQARALFDTRWDDRQDADLSFAERFAVDNAYDEWFGAGGTDVPRWAGGTLGYWVIETYLDENPGVRVVDLVKTPASTFRS